MRELLEYLKLEWSSLAAAPLTFLTFAALAGGIAFALARWRYSGIIETLRERLEGRNQTLEEYRERLHLVPARGSEYERLTHQELKSEALGIVSSLREGLAACRRDESQRTDLLQSQVAAAKTDEERNRLHEQLTSSLLAPTIRLLEEYERLVKVKAILIRDEMMARGAGRAEDGFTLVMYEHPTNPFGIVHVADHLEALAHRLA